LSISRLKTDAEEPFMSSAIGIDYGDSRIGIAVSDRMGLVATPRCVIDGKKSLNDVCKAIGDIYKRELCDAVVIGYPLNMDGSSGNRVHRTEKFIERFSEMFPEAEIVRWDERLTTVAADRAMLSMGVSQKKKGVSDMIAAQMILQGYLESKRAEKTQTGED